MENETVISRRKLAAAIALIIIGLAALTWALMPNNQPPATASQKGSPQAPLQIDNSAAGAQMQAGGIDLQSSMVDSQSADTSTQDSSSAQPANTAAPATQNPPCNSCTPGAGVVCPDSASTNCVCGPSGTSADNIACLEQ